MDMSADETHGKTLEKEFREVGIARLVFSEQESLRESARAAD